MSQSTSPQSPAAPAQPYEIGWDAARENRPYCTFQFESADDRLMYGYGYRDAKRIAALAAGKGA